MRELEYGASHQPPQSWGTGPVDEKEWAALLNSGPLLDDFEDLMGAEFDPR